MQLLGFPPTTRSVLIPILHQIRYSLGFITPSQLVTQLNTQHNPERTDREIFEPMHLVTNWLTVRLRARLNPADLVSDLVNMREQLYDHSHRACIYEVLSLFGLSQRGMSTQESVLGHGPPSSISLTPIEHDMSASFFSMSPTKTRSPFVLKHKPSLRRTMPSTPKWWSHRRNNSASSRANHLGLLNFNTDRRPSLPVTSSPSLLHTSNYHPSGINGIKAFHQSSSSLATSTSAASTEKTVSTANLLSTLMTYNDPEDIRVILLDHFLGLKFHLSPSDSATDWYLGNGISMAEDTAISLENTMVGNKDVMKLQPIFNQIRDVFNLPRPRSSSKRSSYRPKQRLADDLVKQFPHCPPRRDSILGSSDLNHHRNVSFDLEGYIAESTEDGSGETVKDSLDKVFSPEAKDEVAQPSIPGLKSKTKNKHPSLSIAVTDRPKTAASRSIKRRSAGAESTLTMATMFSDTTGLNAGGSSRSGHGHHRFSLMSNFTIREATREYASEAIASRFCLPRRVNSLSTLDYIDHYIPTPTASTFDDYDASIRGQSRFSDDSDRTSLFRASLGEPINVEPLSPDRISTWESYEVTNWSQSEPNLLEFLGTSPDCHSDSPHSHFYRELEMGEDPHDSTYTRLPARMTVGSLRRRSRIKAPWELQLSAYDLGLEDKVSRRQSSSTPRLIPGQSYQDSMMDDQLAKAPVQSYVVNGLDTPPNSPPLDIDITSFIDHQNMTVESSFSHANFTQGPISRVSTPVLPETPVQESKDQRQLHRQWTIFNGEHVSPPKTVLPLPERVLQRPRFPRSKSSPGPELGGSRQFDTTTPSKVASPAMTSPADPVTAKPLPNPPKQFADTSGTSHFDQVRVSPFDNVQVKPSRPRFFRSQSSPGPEVGLSKRSDQTTFSPVIPPRTSSRFSPVVLGALSHLPERVVNTSSTQVPGQVLVEVVRLFQVDSTLGIVRPRSGVTRAEVDQVIKAIKEKHPYGTGDWIVQEIEALVSD